MDPYHTIPINRTAALVTSKGVNDGIELTYKTFEEPLPTKNVPPNTQDLTGVQFGRMTVIGLFDKNKAPWFDKNKSKKKKKSGIGRWVCRCCCGNYELRTAKAIKNPENLNNGNSRCARCAVIKSLDRQHTYRNTGKWKDWS